MRPFAYVRVTGADEAQRALATQPHAAFLAGGTTLIDLMKIGCATPATLIDIGALPLAQIETRSDGTLRIGALAKMNDVADDEHVRAAAPAIARALALSASPQVRNMATIGGNVMQRTRCVYFRDVTQACNKRRNGEGCTAIGGDDRQMAIFGASPRCICVHPSDLAVALLTADATIHLLGPHGRRTLSFDGFHRLPGEDPERDTILGRDELIEAISFVPTALTRNSAYLKVRDRNSFAFALVSVAAGLDVRHGVIRAARLALGGVAAKPWRAHAAEAALIGKPASRATYLAAAQAELAAAKPQRLNAFKTTLARNAMVRALALVGGAA
ncbi:MAG TPA: xanthine dehydrogenase family protein subunit M [Candidatus Sulfotelmatobacter sp.]|nr:xanthine dehydrogenase family protein subunit M [Candidatus Sulfotelmatobacter sp.]